MTEWQKRFVKEYHELRGRFREIGRNDPKI